MQPSEQTIHQIERTIRKIAQKFSEEIESVNITDIHLRVGQDSGELRAYNDDDQEITRCVISEWIDYKDDDFYDVVTDILRTNLKKHSHLVDQMNILKPFSFILEDEDGEHLAELYVADDDTVIIGKDLMNNLEEDLDSFLDHLLNENLS
ncbi:hypothetical protein ABVC70_10230 [Hoylesella timonensis]|uniref:hypothetical protein n=1 Tax=Hoylesella timonensis TaxID=386414 RepID=UPI00336ACB91